MSGCGMRGNTTEEQDSHSWLLSVNAFHQQWFPDDGAVQHFWFGARRPNLRTHFHRLVEDFERPCAAVATASLLRPMSLVGAWASVRGWASCALLRTRLRTAIFLDQMSRNVAALRETPSEDISNFRVACDVAAVQLALSVIYEAGWPLSGARLLGFANVTELCFLSLVLRHSRYAPHIKIALRLLHVVLEELTSRALVERHIDASGIARTPAELCERFLIETQDALDAVDVEKYLCRAFSVDEPLPLSGPPATFTPRVSVLDARCRGCCIDEAASDPPFLRKLLHPACREKLRHHRLVEILRCSLDELGYLNHTKGIVLSLSGGVDSMVTCCLLSLLQDSLPPKQRFKWCALHLCHPNRSDAVDEEGWVQWSCHVLGVDLLTYRLEIRRPHGNLRTGISRDRYEEKSKELRFRMYARCLVRLGVEQGAAFVAHHQDDADENRLAELGKGNILHIDGMTMSSTMLGVEVLRPLLSVRKAELLAFADEVAVCYMQDSTPRWSRRGWIRKVLDEICMNPCSQDRSGNALHHDQLLSVLTRAGEASEKFGNILDASLKEWKMKAVDSAILNVPIAAPGGDAGHASSKKKKKGKLDSTSTRDFAAAVEERPIDVVILWLAEIVALANEFEPHLAALQNNICTVAEVWNAAIDAQNTSPEGGAAGQLATVDLPDGEDADVVDNSPGTCPLQKITVHHGGLSVGPFLFSRAIYAVSNDCAEMQKRLQCQPVARKALSHLWDSIVRARLEYQWGSLHKGCPCLYLRDRCCLVLPDVDGRDEDLADRHWQREFARTALAFTQSLRAQRESFI